MDTNQHLNIENIVKFIGIETVSTPAGDFTTCHFNTASEMTSTSDDKLHRNITDMWYAQKLGIPVKAISTNSVGDSNEYKAQQQLIRAEINGKTFTPSNAMIEKYHLSDILSQ